MQNFDIPTNENRLIRRGDTLYQVMIVTRQRNDKLNKKIVQDPGLQRELKQIVALMLDEFGESDPVVGRKIRVAVKKFESQNDMSKMFAFSKNKKQLKLYPTVFSFVVTVL
jgi:hypothetical protein